MYTNDQCLLNICIYSISTCLQSDLQYKTSQEYDDVVLKLFTEAIDDERKTSSDKRIFTMNYCVPCPDNITSKSKEARTQVCKKAFACVYGCTVNDLEKASDAVKTSSGLYTSGTALRIKMWKDNHIHDFSYKETEELFMLNIGSAGISDIIILISLLTQMFMLYQTQHG